MCRLAAAAGCDVIVATPHQRHPNWWNCETGRLESRLEDLRAALGQRPGLALGAEIRVDSGLLEALGATDESGLLSLAGSRYLLLELSREGSGPDPHEIAHELRLNGWRPIFAHPEFIPALGADAAAMQELIEAGGLMQVTAGSLTGRFGRSLARVTGDLLDHGLIHFVASDAHSIRWRPPDLADACAMITDRWGERTARRLCFDNPRAVIEDRPLS